MLISRDNRYFQDRYQGVPRDGFTPMFEKLLAHEDIEVQLGVEAKERVTLTEGGILLDGEAFRGNVIFTGALDELFDCRFGHLPYRSLRFDFEHLDKNDFQGHSVVNRDKYLKTPSSFV